MPTNPAKRKETEVQAEILAFVNRVGCFCWRNNIGVMRAGKRFIRFGKKGSGDIIGTLPNGRIISIEVKSNGEPMTEDQKDFKTMIETRNGVALVVRCLDDVVAFLESAAWDRWPAERNQHHG